MFFYLLLIFIVIVGICFLFYLFSLMQLMPLYIAAPALFISILLTIQLLANRNRMKGFKGFKE